MSQAEMTEPGDRSDRPADEQRPLGRVMIAPVVLAQIIERTALGVPGVAAMCPRHPRFDRLQSNTVGGVRVNVVDNTVSADVAIVARPDVNVLELGQRIQREVAEAVRRMLGMDVGTLNVYVDDVRAPAK